MEEKVNTETQEEVERKRKFHRVIKTIGNLKKPNELGQQVDNKRKQYSPTWKYQNLKMQK